MKRRIASVLMAVMLITSALVGATGTATAASDGECSNLDVIVGGLTLLWAADDACFETGGDVPDELNATDANETKTELYGSLSTAKASAYNAGDSRSNSLEMTESIAKMEAKNAYIRALDNGSTEATARLKAHQAAEDFYATHQIQMLNQWEIQRTEFERAYNHAEAATGVNPDVFLKIWDDRSSPFPADDGSFWMYNHSKTTTVTLTNGTTRDVPVYYVQKDGYPDDYIQVGPTDASTHTSGVLSDYAVKNVSVAEPYDSYGSGPLTYLEPDVYGPDWTEMESQHQSVKGEVNTYINNTYDQWEAGLINESDMIDPYLASREHSPDEDFQGWALMSLMQTGAQTPANMSQFGHMNVSDHETGEDLTGILMSDERPAGGSFSVGTTYDATTIGGPQYVVTNDTVVELEGNFTVTDAVDMNGENKTEITYTNVTYETTDLTEYKQQMEELNMQIAEINARQEELRNSGGSGGGWLDGNGSVPPGIALGFVAAIVLLALVKD